MLVLPSFLFVLSAFPFPVTAVPSDSKRDFFGLLAGDNATSTAPHPTRTYQPPSSSTSARKPSLSTTRFSTGQQTPAPTSQAGSAQPAAAATALVSAQSILPASAEGHAGDNSSKTWQIIGIVIIAVLFVATSITCAMFFDRLWRFLKDVVCCTSRPLVSEEFIPDCEKQGWDTRSLSSLSSGHDGESLRKEASIYTARTRNLPWNTDSQDWNTLHRQPSRTNDHSPAA